MTIRMLHTLAEARAVVRLFAGIWDAAEDRGPIDVSMVMALAHAGCYVAGAFDDDELIGASVGFIGGRHRDQLHSHITGVREDRTSAGVGFAIKQHQRAWATERGLTTITWTFDPLIARNAYFNLTRLGGRLSEYLIDFYGTMIDGRNLGHPSDRALVRWQLTEPAGAESMPEPMPEPMPERMPGPVAEPVPALIIDPDGLPVLRPELITDAPVELIIPTDIETMRRTDPAAALQWRMALRESLGSLLSDGWTVSGFRRSGGYLLTPPTGEGEP